MKIEALKLIVVGLCCFGLQWSRFHSGDFAHVVNVMPAPSADSVDNDSGWRIRVKRANVDSTTRLTARCSATGDCWFWNSSELLSGAVENVRWIPVRLKKNEYIMDATPVSKDAGWIVTSEGLFRVSNFDADRTSVAVAGFGPKQGRIHAVHFNDDKHGWVAGGVYRPLADGEGAPNNALSDDRQQVLVGAIARTTDGGLSWEMKRFDQTMGRFVGIGSSQRVVLVSGDAGAVSTDDGGETWKDVLADLDVGERLDRVLVSAAFVLNEKRCWLSVSGAYLLTTDDGLKKWKRFSPSAELNEDPPLFADLVFIDERRGLALQMQRGFGQLYKTNDGGKTWTLVKLDHNVFSLAAVPGTSRIIAFGEGRIYSFSPI